MINVLTMDKSERKMRLQHTATVVLITYSHLNSLQLVTSLDSLLTTNLTTDFLSDNDDQNKVKGRRGCGIQCHRVYGESWAREPPSYQTALNFPSPQLNGLNHPKDQQFKGVIHTGDDQRRDERLVVNLKVQHIQTIKRDWRNSHVDL